MDFSAPIFLLEGWREDDPRSSRWGEGGWVLAAIVPPVVRGAYSPGVPAIRVVQYLRNLVVCPGETSSPVLYTRALGPLLRGRCAPARSSPTFWLGLQRGVVVGNRRVGALWIFYSDSSCARQRQVFAEFFALFLPGARVSRPWASPIRTRRARGARNANAFRVRAPGRAFSASCRKQMRRYCEIAACGKQTLRYGARVAV